MSDLISDIKAGCGRIATEIACMRGLLANLARSNEEFLQTYTLEKPARSRKPAETEDSLYIP